MEETRERERQRQREKMANESKKVGDLNLMDIDSFGGSFVVLVWSKLYISKDVRTLNLHPQLCSLAADDFCKYFICSYGPN